MSSALVSGTRLDSRVERRTIDRTPYLTRSCIEILHATAVDLIANDVAKGRKRNIAFGTFGVSILPNMFGRM